MSKRLTTQLIATLVANPFLLNFFRGNIYQGNLKGICVPVLNCYSCPAAVGSCPLGALQNALAAPFTRIPFYVGGFMILVGAVAGRWICGWLCPFGLIQDLLGRLSKIKKKLPYGVTRAKYLVLALLVVLPIIWVNEAGFGAPYFCQYLCPKGTLSAGLPLLASNYASFSPLIGVIFWIKLFILGIILLGSVFIYRPFCRTLCPLGAFYGLFNKISLFRLHYDESNCKNCKRCSRFCPVDLNLPQESNSAECIRCLKCRDNCPSGALTWKAEVKSSPPKSSPENT